MLQLLAEPERLGSIPVVPPPYWEFGDADGGPVDPGAGQVAEVAPESGELSCRFLGLDAQGGLQLIGGLVLAESSSSTSNEASVSSLPRWRWFLS